MLHDRLKKGLQRCTWQKDAGENSDMSLSKDGKLTLTTQIPSLKGESFSIEAGLDPETGLPCVAGSISYEFYNYKMKTEYGDCELNGTATFKNVFTPMLSEGMCHMYVPAQRAMEQALPAVQGAAIAGGLLLLAPNTLPVLAIGGGALVSTPAMARNRSFDEEHKKTQSLDNKVVVIFKARIERKDIHAK